MRADGEYSELMKLSAEYAEQHHRIGKHSGFGSGVFVSLVMSLIMAPNTYLSGFLVGLLFINMAAMLWMTRKKPKPE